MNKRGIAPIATVAIIVAVAVIAVGGYVMLSGNGGEGGRGSSGENTENAGETGEPPMLGETPPVTSVDLTLNGYEKLGAKKFPWNSVLIQARNLDNNPDWRVEVKAEGPDDNTKGDIFIYNHDEEMLYIYDNSEDTWYGENASGETESDIKDNYDGLVTTAQDWASEYGEGEYTETYDGDLVKININAKNTELSDNVFVPPEGTTVEPFSSKTN